MQEPEWIEIEGLVFCGRPRLKWRQPGMVPDGEPIYQIVDDLQAYRQMLGVDEDWKFEAFHNHVHFSHREGEEACLGYQYRDAREKEALFRSRFPSRRFVIEVSPLDRNTAYQAFEGAPTEDDEAWEPNGPLSSVVLHRRLLEPGADAQQVREEVFETYREQICAKCKARWRYELDYPRDGFPGTRWAGCPNCDLPAVVAVRTLRRLVGTKPNRTIMDRERPDR